MGSPIDNLTDRQKEILELLIKNNKHTKRGLAKILDVYVSAVQSDMKALKEKGAIKRVGGTRGFWEVYHAFHIGEVKVSPIGPINSPIGGQIELSDRQKEILKLIDENNEISKADISEMIHISESAIQKHLNALKEKGAIKRIGGTRGYWEVKK